MNILSLALVGSASFGAGLFFGAMVLRANVGPWYGSTKPGVSPVPPDVAHHAVVRANHPAPAVMPTDQLQIVYMQVDHGQYLPFAVNPAALPALPALPIPEPNHDDRTPR